MKSHSRPISKHLSSHTAPKTLWQVFVIPILLTGLTLIGLLSALLGDGLWDILSWMTLGFLVAMIVYYWAKPSSSPH